MALYLLRDMGNDLDTARSTHILNQHFGHAMGVEDLLAPLALTAASPLKPFLRGCRRPCRVVVKNDISTLKKSDNVFHVSLDVQHFKPEEITVKVKDNCIIVEGDHDERLDEHGFVSRRFQRRYVLPEGFEPKNAVSKLSSDGILTIFAPKVTSEEATEHVIPIIQTGPHRVEETVKEDDAKEEK